MFRVAGTWITALAIAIGLSAAHPFAQSQAINGTIEGTITDQSGAALPGVSVTVSNVDTGDTRVVVERVRSVSLMSPFDVAVFTAGRCGAA